MLVAEFIIDTFSHFVKHGDGPPPGIPAHAGAGFEQDLLLLCERRRLSPIIVHSLELLVRKPDLSGLSLERLKRDAKRIGRNNERILAKERLLFSLFQSKGIPCMMLGGAAMSRTVYPSHDLRSIDRLEYLINESDWTGVLECLDAAGFHRASGHRDIEHAQEALRYHQLYAPCVFRDEEGDAIHIRFRLFHLGIPEVEEKTWTRSHAAGSADPFARTAGPEDLLIRQALDLIIADFTELRLVLDIALLLEQNRKTLDWRYVATRLHERGHCAAFHFAVTHVVDLLQLPKPGAALPSPGGLRKHLFDFAWNRADPDYLAAGDRRHNLKFVLLETRSPAERAVLLREILSPSGEWVSAFYGRPGSGYLTLKFIVRSLCGRWMKERSTQEDLGETHAIKPGRHHLE
jgi:hypothetical protein